MTRTQERIVKMTYQLGFTIQTTKPITKNDIITLCNLLNNCKEYKNVCEFEPEGICGGGILFKYKDDENNKGYKSLRFNLGQCNGNWGWVNDNVMTEWLNNEDVVVDKKKVFTTCLKSFHGAPSFTVKEENLLKRYCNKIGMGRVISPGLDLILSLQDTNY